MNPLLMTGTLIVNLALISYTVFFILERKKRALSRNVVFFLSMGLSFDVLATLFMILGSPNSPFSFHGFVGYSALLAMSIETFNVWKTVLRTGFYSPVSKGLHQFSFFAYSWWVAAYLTGALIVFLK